MSGSVSEYGTGLIMFSFRRYDEADSMVTEDESNVI